MIVTVNFSLSIGIHNASQKDTFDVEVLDGQTDEEIQAEVDEYWSEWINNFIDGHAKWEIKK